jgi:hypothetical protein
MKLDPKSLETLRVGYNPLAVAVACGIFLVLTRWGSLPPFPDIVKLLVWAGLLLFGCLGAVKLLDAVLVARFSGSKTPVDPQTGTTPSDADMT